MVDSEHLADHAVALRALKHESECAPQDLGKNAPPPAQTVALRIPERSSSFRVNLERAVNDIGTKYQTLPKHLHLHGTGMYPWKGINPKKTRVAFKVPDYPRNICPPGEHEENPIDHIKVAKAQAQLRGHNFGLLDPDLENSLSIREAYKVLEDKCLSQDMALSPIGEQCDNGPEPELYCPNITALHLTDEPTMKTKVMLTSRLNEVSEMEDNTLLEDKSTTFANEIFENLPSAQEGTPEDVKFVGHTFGSQICSSIDSLRVQSSPAASSSAVSVSVCHKSNSEKGSIGHASLTDVSLEKQITKGVLPEEQDNGLGIRIALAHRRKAVDPSRSSISLCSGYEPDAEPFNDTLKLGNSMSCPVKGDRDTVMKATIEKMRLASTA